MAFYVHSPIASFFIRPYQTSSDRLFLLMPFIEEDRVKLEWFKAPVKWSLKTTRDRGMSVSFLEFPV